MRCRLLLDLFAGVVCFFDLLYTALTTKFFGWGRGDIEMNMSVSICLSVCLSNSSLTDKYILIKLYTVARYDLRTYVKEENPDSKYFKGDN